MWVQRLAVFVYLICLCQLLVALAGCRLERVTLFSTLDVDFGALVDEEPYHCLVAALHISPPLCNRGIYLRKAISSLLSPPSSSRSLAKTLEVHVSPPSTPIILDSHEPSFSRSGPLDSCSGTGISRGFLGPQGCLNVLYIPVHPNPRIGVLFAVLIRF